MKDCILTMVHIPGNGDLPVKAKMNALWTAVPINPPNTIGGLSERAILTITIQIINHLV